MKKLLTGSKVSVFSMLMLTILLFAATASAQPSYLVTDLGGLGGTTSVGTTSFGEGINDSGQVTGQAAITSGYIHAFLYSSGTMTDLGTLGGSKSIGKSINTLGWVTGQSYILGDAASHAFLFDGIAMKDLETLGGSMSDGWGINSSGQITGDSNIAGNLESHAFLYDGTTMHDLGTLGGSVSHGSSINSSGQVVGISETDRVNAIYHAFLYNGTTMFDLNDLIPSSSGWVLQRADKINDYGQIACTGRGTISNWAWHALLLTPGAAAPVMTGTVVLGSLMDLTFSDFVSAGTVTAIFVPPGSLPPISNFAIVGGSSYDITTTASFSGDVTICISYDPTRISVPEDDLVLLHYTNGSGTPLPSQWVDKDNKKVCGLTSSFSVFAVAQPTKVPLSTLSAKLRIHSGPPPSFDLNASFILGGRSDGIDPLAELVALQVGTYSVTIPAGSFQQLKNGSKKGTYIFSGVINGVTLSIQMVPPGVTGDGWNFKASATPVDLSGLSNPVTVTITIGNDSGRTVVNANF